MNCLQCYDEVDIFVSCQICKNILCFKCLNLCIVCEKCICQTCMMFCAKCETSRCVLHFIECSYCKKRMCPEQLTYYYRDNEYHCRTCIRDYIRSGIPRPDKIFRRADKVLREILYYIFPEDIALIITDYNNIF